MRKYREALGFVLGLGGPLLLLLLLLLFLDFFLDLDVLEEEEEFEEFVVVAVAVLVVAVVEAEELGEDVEVFWKLGGGVGGADGCWKPGWKKREETYYLFIKNFHEIACCDLLLFLPPHRNSKMYTTTSFGRCSNLHGRSGISFFLRAYSNVGIRRQCHANQERANGL